MEVPTKDSAAKTLSTITFIPNIDHNLNLYENAKNYQEEPLMYNKETILVINIGSKISTVKYAILLFFRQHDIINISIFSTQYRFISKIAYGGFSIVWLVIDLKTNTFKVLKLLRYGHQFDSDEIKVSDIP